MSKITKKCTNNIRVARLRKEMDELNYCDRVIADLLGPLRQRKMEAATKVQEYLLDEGIDPTLLSKISGLEVDDVACEIRYTLKEEPKPTAKKPAKKPTKKPAKKSAKKPRKTVVRSK